jgi:hypothetical protein
MNISVADYLQVITPHLHPDLVSPEILSHIQGLEPILPCLTENLFECRLGTDLTEVDFSFYLPPLTKPLPERFLTSPVWRSFQDFYHEWTNPTSNLHEKVQQIGMEFDLEQSVSDVPIPCIFWELNRETSCSFPDLISEALGLLNYPLSPLIESNLRLCADVLPDQAKFAHFAVMLSRPGLGVRVNAIAIPPNQLLDYLLKIGWSDPTEALSPLVYHLSELVDYVVLAFDVGEKIYPRIGLECYLRKQPRYEPRWNVFLDNLVDLGLCLPAKRDALLTWSGIDKQKYQAEGNLSWESVFSQSMYSVYWRMINHIKIVYQPGYPLEAKGYLASGHRWIAG